MVEAWTYSVRRNEGFVGLGGYSAYQEATEILSQGSRQPCIPSLKKCGCVVGTDQVDRNVGLTCTGCLTSFYVPQYSCKIAQWDSISIIIEVA